MREIRARALKVAQRLEKDGIKLGDRVATLAWNTWRHLEAWYGILGIGAIYHTVNPRLFPEQIAWIINHAGDRMMMTDLTFVPLLEKIADKLPIDRALHRPHRRGAYAEDNVEERGRLRRLDRRSRRRLYLEELRRKYRGRHVLHVRHHRAIRRACSIRTALTCCTPSWRRCRIAKDLSSRDVVLPVVPMFHANGWSLAFSTPMVGASLVMPGAKLDGASIYELLNTYKVTFTAAVPTVWLMLLQDLEKTGGKLPHLKRVVIGGSACPRAMTQDLPGKIRRRGRACLGHDGDEPARLALHDEARICRAHRRGEAGH